MQCVYYCSIHHLYSNTKGLTPLAIAVNNNKVATARALLAYSTHNHFIKDERTLNQLLFSAANQSQLPMVQLLLEHGADISSINGQGENLLHIAIEKENNELIDFLLSHERCQTLLYGTDDAGIPLESVVRKNDIQLVERLVAQDQGIKTNLNRKDRDGGIPLWHAAISCKSPAMARLLVDRGANKYELCRILNGSPKQGRTIAQQVNDYLTELRKPSAGQFTLVDKDQSLQTLTAINQIFSPPTDTP